MSNAWVRTRTVWLVLLMAVLLPLRGWAMVTMPGMPWSEAPSHSAGQPVAVTAPPCHGGVDSGHAWADAAGAAGAATSSHAGPHAGLHADLHADHGPGEDGSPSLHTCACCALCHSALAADALQAPLGPLQLAEARCLLPARDTGRLLVGTLERPPRA